MIKLAVFGDSYASFNPINEHSWPKLVSKTLSIEADFYAKAGTSMWWAYKQFKKYYKKYDIIIFSFTSSSRWPNLPKSLLGQEFNIGYKKDNSMLDIINPYFNSLFPEDFQNFISKNIHKEIIESCKKENKYIIQIIPFLQTAHSKIRSKFDFELFPNDYPIISALDIISHKEEVMYQGKHRNTCKLLNGLNIVDHRDCHLNPSNNMVVANWIVDCIKEMKYNIHLECEKNLNVWTNFDQTDSDEFNKNIESRRI